MRPFYQARANPSEQGACGKTPYSWTFSASSSLTRFTARTWKSATTKYVANPIATDSAISQSLKNSVQCSVETVLFVIFNCCVNNVPDLFRFFRINVIRVFHFNEAIYQLRICVFRIRGICRVISDLFIRPGIIRLRDFNIHRIGIIHRFVFFREDQLIELSIFRILTGSLKLFGMDHYW